MNKKIIICIAIVLIIIAITILVIWNNKQNTKSNETDTSKWHNNTEDLKNEQGVIEIENDTNFSIQEKDIETINEDEIDMMQIKVNNRLLQVKLENNNATKSLVEKLKNGDISIDASEYGGFEKIGNLGFNLPRNDTNITTSAGDIVLYQGNQISLFYNSNSWNYTRIGKVQNISSDELKSILGSGDVTLVLSID